MTKQLDDILKERGSRYGTFEGHAKLSQQLKEALVQHAWHLNKELEPDHWEALEMICHKMARIVNGDPDYDDSWRDIAGYADLIVKRLNGEVI